MDKPQAGLSADEITKAYLSMPQGQRGAGGMFIIIGLYTVYLALKASETVPLSLILPSAVILVVTGLIAIVFTEAVVEGVLALGILLLSSPKLLASGISSWGLGQWMLLGFVLLLLFGFLGGLSIERKYKQLPPELQTVTRSERAHLVFPQFALALVGLALLLLFAWWAVGQVVSETVRAVILDSSFRTGVLGMSIGLVSLYARFPRKALSVTAVLIGCVVFASHWLFPYFFTGQ